MRNYLALCLSTRCFCIQKFLFLKQQKVLKILKPDGKILEFKASVLVNDLLIKFPNSGIVASKESTEHLPLHQELKIGNVYYLVPAKLSDNKPKSEEIKEESGERSKRIKVVITKQQLQELLSKKVSMEEFLLSALHKDGRIRRSSSVVSVSNWKPQLESIPE